MLFPNVTGRLIFAEAVRVDQPKVVFGAWLTTTLGSMLRYLALETPERAQRSLELYDER